MHDLQVTLHVFGAVHVMPVIHHNPLIRPDAINDITTPGIGGEDRSCRRVLRQELDGTQRELVCVEVGMDDLGSEEPPTVCARHQGYDGKRYSPRVSPGSRLQSS